MSEFKQYRRKQLCELRPWELGESLVSQNISISTVDQRAGSPKLGDMIARNPNHHEDMWLVSAAYFADNYEPI